MANSALRGSASRPQVCPAYIQPSPELCTPVPRQIKSPQRFTSHHITTQHNKKSLNSGRLYPIGQSTPKKVLVRCQQIGYVWLIAVLCPHRSVGGASAVMRIPGRLYEPEGIHRTQFEGSGGQDGGGAPLGAGEQIRPRLCCRCTCYPLGLARLHRKPVRCVHHPCIVADSSPPMRKPPLRLLTCVRLLLLMLMLMPS